MLNWQLFGKKKTPWARDIIKRSIDIVQQKDIQFRGILGNSTITQLFSTETSAWFILKKPYRQNRPKKKPTLRPNPANNARINQPITRVFPQPGKLTHTRARARTSSKAPKDLAHEKRTTTTTATGKRRKSDDCDRE